MMPKPINDMRKFIYWVTLAISVIGIAAMYALTPYGHDDLWYMMTSQRLEGWDKFAAVCSEVWRHWHFDTGRLCNLISPPFLTVVPKWLFGLLSGAMLLLMVEMCRMICGISRDSFRALLLVAGIVLVLPWFDCMFTAIFGLNYLWTSAVVFTTLYYIIKFDQGWRCHGWRLYGLMLLALPAGWLHEGFSVPVIAGFAAYWFVTGRRPPRRALSLMAFFCLGALLIVIAPAFHNRLTGFTSAASERPLWESAMAFLAFNCVFYFAAVLFIVALCRSKMRHRLLANREHFAVIAFLFVAGAVTTALFFKFYTGSRVAWLSQLAGMMIALMLFGYGNARLSRHAFMLLGSCLLVILGVHLALSVKTQASLSSEYRAIRDLYLASTDGCVFYDNTQMHLDATLWKPSFRQFNERAPLQEFSYYYGPDKPDLTLLPSRLESVDTTRLKFDDEDSAMAIYDGLILCVDTLQEHMPRTILLSYDGQNAIETRFRREIFRDVNGRYYALIVPHTQKLLNSRKPIWARRRAAK